VKVFVFTPVNRQIAWAKVIGAHDPTVIELSQSFCHEASAWEDLGSCAPIIRVPLLAPNSCSRLATARNCHFVPSYAVAPSPGPFGPLFSSQSRFSRQAFRPSVSYPAVQ
jgi:hypothetical protein